MRRSSHNQFIERIDKSRSTNGIEKAVGFYQHIGQNLDRINRLTRQYKGISVFDCRPFFEKRLIEFQGIDQSSNLNFNRCREIDDTFAFKRTKVCWPNRFLSITFRLKRLILISIHQYFQWTMDDDAIAEGHFYFVWHKKRIKDDVNQTNLALWPKSKYIQ